MLVALVAGALFGVGLIVADMTNPARVKAFLDLFGGAWDPTLGFVMGGAILPMLVAWAVTKAKRPLFDQTWPPLRTEIDGKLIGGGAAFGVGWGLSGFCPGPALTALSFGGPATWIFVAAMAVGMAAQGLVAGRAAPA